jgi:DNA-binding IclR family transcriptional regulator
MVFPAHRVTGGLVLLAELRREQVDTIYAAERYADRPDERPDPERLHRELKRIRSGGFALNQGRSERGVVALGRPVRTPDGEAVACLSLSMPSVRYDPHRLPFWLAAIGSAVGAVEADLASPAA